MTANVPAFFLERKTNQPTRPPNPKQTDRYTQDKKTKSPGPGSTPVHDVTNWPAGQPLCAGTVPSFP